MKSLFDFAKKNTILLSILGTILSSLATGAWYAASYIVQRVAKTEATISSLQDWVQDHDDSINAQHDAITVLKEDERLREAGLLKK